MRRLNKHEPLCTVRAMRTVRAVRGDEGKAAAMAEAYIRASLSGAQRLEHVFYNQPWITITRCG
jgi:hypothetical protein